MQQREDGPFVDQIVSARTYFTAAPGPHNGDATTLPEGSMNKRDRRAKLLVLTVENDDVGRCSGR